MAVAGRYLSRSAWSPSLLSADKVVWWVSSHLCSASYRELLIGPLSLGRPAPVCHLQPPPARETWVVSPSPSSSWTAICWGRHRASRSPGCCEESVAVSAECRKVSSSGGPGMAASPTRSPRCAHAHAMS
eukprot:2199642-Prorocentrum_lima.AAC.1